MVLAQSDFVNTPVQVRQNVLTELFDSALKALAQTDTSADAWLRFIQPDDRIGLKFSPYGDEELVTSEAFGRLLVSSLVESGWSSDQIVMMDGPPAIVDEFNLKSVEFGWSAPVDFGSGQDRLSAFLDQVTAIVNVPFLKTDNITGLSACLKNITYHLVKHPARYHAGRCSPFMADVLALRQVRDKLKLNIVNGLNIVFEGGPLVCSSCIHRAGLILLGDDPLAVDAVALEQLNQVRELRDLPPILLDAENTPALLVAAARGLGQIDFRRIERLKVGGP